MLETAEIIISIVIPLIAVIYGSLIWRLKKVEDKLQNSIDRYEVEHLIDTKQESIKVLQQEIKEDIHLIRDKLDQLAEKL